MTKLAMVGAPFSLCTRHVIARAGFALNSTCTSLRNPRSCVPCPTLNEIVADRLPASRLYNWIGRYSTSRPDSLGESGRAPNSDISIHRSLIVGGGALG